MISTATKSKVQLEVFELESDGCKYQTLSINLVEPRDLIDVSEMLMLEIPLELDLQREIILFGMAPNWLYNYLVSRFHNAPLLACFNALLKAAVVISSNISQFQPGDLIPVNTNKTPGVAILICGVPDSGKSTLSYELRKNLPSSKPDAKIFLHRANWDGEGNHTLENPDSLLASRLKKESKRKIHLHPDADKLMPEYFDYHAKAVKNLRKVFDLVLVDVGGKAEAVKKAVIDECSHYIIISKCPEKIQEWHNLCEEKLKTLAVIHSVWEEKLEVLRTQPYLEIIAGKWQKSMKIPDVLLNEILNV
jgi:CRISPR-associated protein Csx3